MSIPTTTGRILLVDPDPGILLILREILKDTVGHVETSTDGRDAFARLQSGTFDVLLCEMVLPMTSGISLLAQLSKESKLIPSILITRFVDRLNIIQALRAGAVDFIQKPFDENLVREVVRNALTLGPSFHKNRHVHKLPTSGLKSHDSDQPRSFSTMISGHKR